MAGRHEYYGIYEKYLKRPLDCIFSLVALLVLSPVFAVTALLVKIMLGSPVFFTQKRPGRHGKIFKLFKFRSMTDAKDENGQLLPDQSRMTKFGKILRTTSLDELPELFNIIKGDMSIVGPRPLLVRYLPRYSERQARRHEVRPGLTGWAQVNGRNLVSWEEKFENDVYYVDHISFLMDMKIIFKTFSVVFGHKGISIDIPEFMGMGEKE